MADSKPLSWTLRFKNHNVTILLLVSPAETFDNIRTTLLKALQVRGIREINGVQVPEDPSDIELGAPVDRNNLEKGWVQLDLPSDPKTGAKKKSKVSESPQGLDLRDSQAVAFRFRTAESKGKIKDEDEMDVDDPGWDVIIPAYEDDEEEEEEEEEEQEEQE